MPRFTLFKSQPNDKTTLKQYYYPEESKISIQRESQLDQDGELTRITFDGRFKFNLDIGIMRIRKTMAGMRTIEQSISIDKKQLGVLLERLKAIHENME